MFAGSARKGISLQGYIDRGQLDPGTLMSRHDDVSLELIRRGFRHVTPLWQIHLPDRYPQGILMNVDWKRNMVELASRCNACSLRIKVWLERKSLAATY